jgi:lipopolysaccharide export system protein LptA
MYSGESEVYSERGRYNTVDKLAYLLDRSVLYNDNKDVTADSIFYNMNSGFSEVFGNIVYNDTVNRNMLTGEYAYLNEVVDSAYVTGRAVVTDYSQKDSLFMHADTIWAVSYNLDTDSLYRQIKAYNKVRAWGKEMQAVCDSLIFDSRDSCMTMYKDPILWNNGIQLLGEEIKIYMDTASIDWVHIINQTLYAEYVDSSESADYNQVKGQEMKFYFDDGKINEMQVIGSVEIIFYPIDESDSTYVGMNTTVAGRITAYLKDGQVERLFVPKEAKGVLYPMGQRPADKRFLDNFVWFDYVRPLSKEDIFNWRGKGSNLELKVIRRENIPLPTLDGMKGKKK